MGRNWRKFYWLQFGPTLLTVVPAIAGKTTNSKARRAQRQRQSDRALSTLAKANTRLQRHHGSASAMPPKADGDVVKADWLCKSCTTQAGKPWRNKGALTACSKCRLHKGACFGQKFSRDGTESPTTSAKGLKSPPLAGSGAVTQKQSKELEDMRRKMEGMEQLLKANGIATAGTPVEGASKAGEAKAEGAAAAKPEQAKHIQSLVDEICKEVKKYMGVPKELHSSMCLPNGGPTIQQHLVDLAIKKEQLLAQKNGTLPLRLQVERLKRLVETDRKNKERLGTEKESIDKQIQVLLEKQEEATSNYKAADAKLSVDTGALAQLEAKLKLEAPPSGEQPPVDPADLRWVLTALGNTAVQQAMVKAGISETEHAKTQAVMVKLQAVVAASSPTPTGPPKEVVVVTGSQDGPTFEEVNEEVDEDMVQAANFFANVDLDDESLQAVAQGIKKREGENDEALEKRRSNILASGKACRNKGTSSCGIRRTATKSGEKEK